MTDAVFTFFASLCVLIMVMLDRGILSSVVALLSVITGMLLSKFHLHSLFCLKGLSPGDSGILLKCQVCGFSADTPAQLQQHVHTHLEIKVPIERSQTPRQGSPSTSDLSESQDQELSASMPRPESSSPGANGGAAISRDSSPLEQVKIKEEPCSDSEKEARDGEQDDDHVIKAEEEQSSHPTSPKSSPPAISVKAEPASPTPGSSPVNIGAGGSVLPSGAVFLPQYLFSPEAAIMPQASEILAKMSEMVHSRLKQGQSPASAQQNFFPAGSPAGVLKGATCFECDITFNNINNYYAHKRLYCSGRHQLGEAGSQLTDGQVTAASPTRNDASPQARPMSAPTSASPNELAVSSTVTLPDAKPVEVKSETPGSKETSCSSSSEGESGGGGRASEGSQSPAELNGSAEDQDDELTRTFCQACNIRFSRHENYMVHKRFYCASRHDPSNQRFLAGKAAFVPQPIRTRKRKKMYEIHMLQNEARARAAASGLAVKQEGASPTSVLGPSTVSTSTHGSSPERDGPIDLSKKPCLRETSRGPNVAGLPLSDYHKCTACSISFNSIENYLAHKTYYCPATALQPQTREQLHRLKRPASTSPKSRAPDQNPDTIVHQTGKPTVSVLPSLDPTSHSVPGVKIPTTLPIVCPYCPPNRAVTSDLVEHFRTTHGMVLSLQQQSELQPASVSPRNSASPRNGAPLTPPKPGPRPHRDSLNGRTRKDAVSPHSSPLMNGSPEGQRALGPGSPKVAPPAVSPTGSMASTASPGSETLKDVGTQGSISTPVVYPEKAQSQVISSMPKAGLTSPVQNGNTRYCRLCNIKFSSLSTFIAHKKYYCSSHSAEHVK